MKTNTLLKEACQIVNLLEHHSEDDYTNYRIEELFLNVDKNNNSLNDETRDIAIRIVDKLIEKYGWETDDPESEWYPFDTQDEIHDIINEALGVKE